MGKTLMFLLQQQILDAVSKERKRCAKIVETMRPSGGRQWTDEQLACFEALTEAAKNICNPDIIIDPEGKVGYKPNAVV